jgi:hypothetical protein
MLKFLMKVLFDPRDARHIAHWATADSEHNASNEATAITITAERTAEFQVLLSIRSSVFFGGRRRGSLITQFPGSKTIREKHQQHKADANDQPRHDCQY